MIKFTPEAIRVQLNGMIVTVNKSFSLQHREGSTRIYKNTNDDLLIFTSGEIQIAHGTLLVRILDPIVCRELRANF